MSFMMVRLISLMRHPELVSGSISQPHMAFVNKTRIRRRAASKASDETARWTLKRVQGDGVLGMGL